MPTTHPSFLERLILSQLLDSEQLAQAQAASRGDEAALVEYLVQRQLVTPFQVRQLRAGATNFCVGKYVIHDWLGRGGIGTVYQARHKLMPLPPPPTQAGRTYLPTP